MSESSTTTKTRASRPRVEVFPIARGEKFKIRTIDKAGRKQILSVGPFNRRNNARRAALALGRGPVVSVGIERERARKS